MSLADVLRAHRVSLSMEDALGLPKDRQFRGRLAERMAARWLAGTPGIDVVREGGIEGYRCVWSESRLAVFKDGWLVHEFDLLVRTPEGPYAVEVKAGGPRKLYVRRARIYSRKFFGEECGYLLLAQTPEIVQHRFVQLDHGVTAAQFRDAEFRHLHS